MDRNNDSNSISNMRGLRRSRKSSRYRKKYHVAMAFAVLFFLSTAALSGYLFYRGLLAHRLKIEVQSCSVTELVQSEQALQTPPASNLLAPEQLMQNKEDIVNVYGSSGNDIADANQLDGLNLLDGMETEDGDDVTASRERNGAMTESEKMELEETESEEIESEKMEKQSS